MKYTLHSFWLTALLMLLSHPLFAYDFEVDGICYIITSSSELTVRVTWDDISIEYIDCNSYGGDISIPSTVLYSGKTYSVTSIGSSAFSGCPGLTSIDIPNSVTSIGNDAFKGCSGLKNVKIEDGTTSLALGYMKNSNNSSYYYGLFKDCPIETLYLGRNLTYSTHSSSSSYPGYGCPFEDVRTLKSVTIGNNVTNIGSYAFHGCTGLTSITIPNSVTSIGDAAFSGCAGLASITIPNSVTSISNSAFSGCKGLVNIDIPNSVTSIGNSAFSGCKGLVNIDIPNSVTSIGNSAFSGCKGLVNIDIPNSVTSIEEATFAGCSGLISITIPTSVTSIENSAFENCSGLREFTIPQSVTSIGNDAVKGCTSIKNIKFEDGVASLSLGYKSNSNSSYYYGLFKDCPIETLYLGRNLTYSTHTLYNNEYGSPFESHGSTLTNVTIGNNVTNIGEYAFYGCTGLESISISNNVTSIGIYAFAGCTGLSSITIPNSVTSIGFRAFNGCTGLTDITIPNSVTSIGSSAFNGCTGLTDITMPNSMTSIESSTFQGCSGLTNISIPNSVDSIGYEAFKGCSGLTNLTIPQNVTFIGSDAFSGCLNIRNVKFEDSTNSLSLGCTRNTNDNSYYYRLFKDCPIESLYIGRNLTYLGNGSPFENKSSLNCVNVGKNVTSIGNSAFHGCTNLKEVYNFSTLAIKKGDTGNGYVAYYADYVYNNCQWDGDYIFTIKNNKKYVCGYKGTETHLVLPDVDGISEGAFYDYPTLTNVTLPNGLTFISSSAFDGCCELQYNEYDNAQYLGNEENPLLFLIKSKDKDISSCEIDKDCKYIAEKAFFESTGLKSLTIPSQVKGINNCAFQGCTNLKTLYNYSELSFTKGSTSHGYVAYYADYVYNNCQKDGDYIYTIADGKKYICKYFGTETEIILPEVDGICDYAFSNCPNLNNITIPNSVTKIAPNAFYVCTSLKYNEHDNALYLGNEENPYLALIKAKNTSIASCCVHKNCQCVADDAFKNCNDLKKVFNFSDLSINKGSNSYGYIGYYADFVYNHCKMEGDYVFSGKNDKEYICGYVGNETELILPEADGIDDGAFKNSMMKEVTIPNSVTNIGYNAFQGCKNLTWLIIPANIESIESEAFASCNNLKRVYNCSTLTLRSNSSYNGYVAYYASYVYNNCQKEGDYVLTTESDQKYVCGYVGKETELVLPEADGISNDAFNGCNALTCVSLPNSMKSIGSNAFYNCSELINVSLSENLTIIGSYAFYNCNKLQDFVLHDALTSIDDYAFYGCTKLTSITIPNDVNLIGDYAFRGCKGLTNVTINNGVTNIGKYAFYDCSGLTSISIPNSVTSIGNSAFTGCTGTLFLNCDTEDAESVADSWFYNSKFTEVVIGNEVTKIGKNAFYGLTSITRLTIGSNLNRIGYDAFNKCTGLKGIYSNALTPPHCRDTAFDEDTKWDCPLYVPATSIEEYKTAEVWKDFLAIKENPEYSGIECLTYDGKSSIPALDLQGQLVSTPTKGKVYIQNGKKFLMK